MDTFPKTVKLRDGRKILLRPMVAADARPLHQYFMNLTDQTRRYLRDDVRDPQVIEQWAQELDYERALPILAFDGETVVGDATLHHSRRQWQRHLCEIRLTVAESHRRQGLGTHLVHELLRLAVNRHLEKCVAQVMESDIASLAVFQRLGFHIESVLRGFAIDAEGKKQDVVVLCNEVGELWQHLEDLFIDLDLPPRMMT